MVPSRWGTVRDGHRVDMYELRLTVADRQAGRSLRAPAEQRLLSSNVNDSRWRVSCPATAFMRSLSRHTFHIPFWRRRWIIPMVVKTRPSWTDHVLSAMCKLRDSVTACPCSAAGTSVWVCSVDSALPGISVSRKSKGSNSSSLAFIFIDIRDLRSDNVNTSGLLAGEVLQPGIKMHPVR